MKKNKSEITEIKKIIYEKQGIKAQGYWKDKEVEELITEYMEKRFKQELDKRVRV